jgi:2-hydroxychromene-2-carboxylate isomerase
MSLTIEVFYSFQSPYCYLALDSIYELEEQYDVQLLWQVFSAKAAGQEVPSYPVIPEKLMYLFEDTKRIAADLNLPIVFSEGWPESEFDPTRVSRGALIANDMGILKEYNYKVFSRWWGAGENPNEQNFMTELADELDIDQGDFLSKISATDTRERVKGLYKRGKKVGVFDTPTLVIDSEKLTGKFVGFDKIHYVKAKLDQLGLRKGAAAR